MIILFSIGSFATVVGIVASWYLIGPERVLGEDGKILSGLLTGTYTGGSVNFNTVALTFNFQDRGIVYAGAIAVDNVITAMWILITIALPAVMRRFLRIKKGALPQRETIKKIIIH